MAAERNILKPIYTISEGLVWSVAYVAITGY